MNKRDLIHDPAKRLKLVLGVAVLCVILGASVLVVPVAWKSIALQNEITYAKHNLLKMRNTLSYRTQLKDAERNIDAELATQLSAVPYTANQTEILKKMQLLAYECKHWMAQFDSTRPAKNSQAGFWSWETTLTVEGNWIDTLNYLKNLRDMERMVRVTSIVSETYPTLRKVPIPSPKTKVHWDVGAYPARTTIVCTLYYIPGEIEDALPSEDTTPTAGDATSLITELNTWSFSTSGRNIFAPLSGLNTLNGTFSHVPTPTASGTGSTSGITLVSIEWANGKYYATVKVSGKTYEVTVGQSIGTTGWVAKSIGSDSITVQKNGTSQVLEE